MDIKAFRAEFPITRERSYLYAGAIAPAAKTVQAAAAAWVDSWARRPLELYDDTVAQMELLRSAFARLIGADPDEVAIADGTSRASAIAARLLAKRPGSAVVVDETTYPSARYAWLTNTDKRLRPVSLTSADDPAAALAAALDDDVAAVSISHVAPLTGYRHQLAPLAAAAHEAGALLIVDAAQSTGAVDIDVRRDGVDVLVTTAMKWLLGPPGIGFLYVSRELLEKGERTEVGTLSVRVEGEGWPPDRLADPASGARRLEPGFPAVPGLAAARAGIELVERVGVRAIEERVGELVEQVLRVLDEHGVPIRTPRDPARRAGVVAADHPRPLELGGFLAERGVDIGVTPWGLIRIDPHAFCDEDDVRRLADGLAAFASGG